MTTETTRTARPRLARWLIRLIVGAHLAGIDAVREDQRQDAR